MRQLISMLVVCVAVSGCAGKMIDEGMSKMVGQPLSAAISKLGMPNEERMIAGQKVYIWESSMIDEGTQYKCQIRVIMSGDRIASFDYEGNGGRCMRYATRLQQ